eukprot:scaffold181287_cov27-Tisochrysis_lutea.AAC.1
MLVHIAGEQQRHGGDTPGEANTYCALAITLNTQVVSRFCLESVMRQRKLTGSISTDNGANILGLCHPCWLTRSIDATDHEIQHQRATLKSYSIHVSSMGQPVVHMRAHKLDWDTEKNQLRQEVDFLLRP